MGCGVVVQEAVKDNVVAIRDIDAVALNVNNVVTLIAKNAANHAKNADTNNSEEQATR